MRMALQSVMINCDSTIKAGEMNFEHFLKRKFISVWNEMKLRLQVEQKAN